MAGRRLESADKTPSHLQLAHVSSRFLKLWTTFHAAAAAPRVIQFHSAPAASKLSAQSVPDALLISSAAAEYVLCAGGVEPSAPQPPLRIFPTGRWKPTPRAAAVLIGCRRRAQKLHCGGSGGNPAPTRRRQRPQKTSCGAARRVVPHLSPFAPPMWCA